MSEYLGLDTSNYTTSCAVFDTKRNILRQEKKLLPVRSGDAGLRQSDAVFHHTKQLPEIMEKLLPERLQNLKAIGVSVRPRNIEGSYMPCFLCGQTLARGISSVTGAEIYETSHQTGHILAALYSAKKLSLIKEPFIAFHVSGGTTDCLYCEPCSDTLFKITELGTSLDLKAGQAVDRVGIMLGLRFPCGRELEKLAMKSTRRWKVKPVIKDGSCCLSGLENQCRKLISDGVSSADTAMYCLKAIEVTVAAMTREALLKKGDIPIIYAGGVMSDRLIRDSLEREFGAFFAEPEFSCDNAAGTAVYAAIMNGGMQLGDTYNFTA
ncbi:MAG: peptidase M22 [Ruminococcus sp.]|nr:peptidase M22 [Ruminococcus sp.]